MKRILTLILLTVFMTAGCAPQMGSKETGGTIIGAGTGALIGSQIGRGKGQLVAVAIGTLAGALIGGEVGRSLDRADQIAMQRNAQVALETNRTNQGSTWVNPDTGHSGTLTPVQTYQNPEGQYCREYVQTVNVGGQSQQAYGTACRQPDGSWMIVR
jgi:surface antigen